MFHRTDRFGRGQNPGVLTAPALRYIVRAPVELGTFDRLVLGTRSIAIAMAGADSQTSNASGRGRPKTWDGCVADLLPIALRHFGEAKGAADDEMFEP